MFKNFLPKQTPLLHLHCGRSAWDPSTESCGKTHYLSQRKFKKINTKTKYKKQFKSSKGAGT
jgi:hypothetical protein